MIKLEVKVSWWKWFKSVKDAFTAIPVIFQIQFIGDKLMLKHIGGVCALYLNSNIDIN